MTFPLALQSLQQQAYAYSRRYGDDISVIMTYPTNLDAFARERVSTPYTVLDYKHTANNLALFFDDQETAGSSVTASVYDQDRASIVLSVDASTAAERVRQSYMRAVYQPGKSQLVTWTRKLGSPQTGITKLTGLGDERNGYFFKLDEDGLHAGLRSYVTGTPIDTFVHQSNWNIDSLNGSGPSQINLDTSKEQIYFVDFEWLGVGAVAFGVVYARQRIYTHIFYHSNELDSVYLSTPNLPIRDVVTNDGTGAASELEVICSSVISEGGQEPSGLILSADRDATTITTPASTAWTPVISVRLKETGIGANVDILNFTLLCTSTAVYQVGLFLNPDIGGTDVGSGSWTSDANSAVEYTTARTNSNVVTNGTKLFSMYAEDTGGFFGGSAGHIYAELKNARRLGSSIRAGNAHDGAVTRDEIVLAVRSTAGTAETFLGGLTWREQY